MKAWLHLRLKEIREPAHKLCQASLILLSQLKPHLIISSRLVSHFITYGGRENSNIPTLLIHRSCNPLSLSLPIEWHSHVKGMA